MAPQFLQITEILLLHQRQIERFGGAAEVRDVGLLQSAIAAPQASFGGKYLLADLFEMAAAYIFHIAQNHPFVDGNKRTALAAGGVFLRLNGYRLVPAAEDLEALMFAVARGERSRAEIAEFLRRSVELDDRF